MGMGHVNATSTAEGKVQVHGVGRVGDRGEAMIAKRIVGLLSPSLWFGIGCLLLIVGGVILWWIQEDFEPTVQRNMLWRPYPACRIVGWSFVTFFVLFALFGLTYTPPPPPSLRGIPLDIATLLVSGILALLSVIWWVVGWLLAHLVIVLHNLWIRFIVTPQDIDPREVEFREMLRAGRGAMDPDEIIERMRRRFHEDPTLTIRHFARALPPPQPTNE
jgi:hypothetical protein